MSLHPAARRSGLVLVAGALSVTLAACGGGSSATPSGGTQAPSSSRGPGQGGTRPGAFGTVAAVTGSTAQVQNPQNGQVAVTFSDSTTFTETVSGALRDVTAGSCVEVTGTGPAVAGQPLTAKSVTITQAGTSGCRVPGNGGASRTPNPSRTPDPSRQPRPSGSASPSAAGRAFGTVSAVSANGFTTHGTSPAGGPAVDTAVTVDSATTFTKTVSANSSAVVVGVCVAAFGTADDTGAITAKSITVSKPGPNGCNTGFGQGGRRGGNGGNGG
ncbi:DUF5666 domain-containing protein [Kutzneria albida]|uniref:Uncharacterized protein n=1 Tax=Kutzneria albida DSM 43870 TaxID=1449976 RepID=W5WME5_9PSEU|nr:DUF5666 domain-containing protein [Kutzneria albida]AHI01692.1 hypothetical protein KALB_8335 [Kutzneria albida DSM 43870]